MEKIMHDQKLSFDGYMRMEVLSDLSPGTSKIMTNDVVILCSKFYILDIISFKISKHTEFMTDGDNSWMEYDVNKSAAELFTLHAVCNELNDNAEYFIGCRMLRICMKYDQNIYDKELLAESHDQLGGMISQWNVDTNNDQEILLEVAEQYKAAMELDPDNDRYRYDYGDMLEEYTHFEAAKDQYLKAIELNSSNAAAMSRLAYCYSALGDEQNAMKYFKMAIDVDKNNAEYYIEFGNYYYKYVRNHEEARKYLAKAIELEPDKCEAYRMMGVVLRDGFKDYKESEKHYLKCLEIEALNYGANSSYGYLLYLMGHYEKAKEYVEIEIANMTRNIWVHFYHGLIFCALGDNDAATKSLYKAVGMTKTPMDHKDVLTTVVYTKKNDSINKEFYDRFKELVCEKFGDNE